jgi:hypothetical protein
VFVITTIAVPLFAASAWLVAVSWTGPVTGTDAGAKKSTLPETGPLGVLQGFDPMTHIRPAIELPFGIPFTDQVTDGSAVLVTVAVNDLRWLTGTEAEEGVMLTTILLVTVTAADATTGFPPCGVVVAWIVMGFVGGIATGAVYRAVFTVALTIVPRVAFPPVIPLASQVTGAPVARQNETVNTCVCARATLAAEGEIELVEAHVIVTLAVPNFEVSATLVAVTVTVAGDGGDAGAVYRAEVGPFETIVPTLEFPPAMPPTLHVTPGAGLPVAETVAVNM